MLAKFTRPRLLGLLIGIVGMTLFAAACSGDSATPTTQATSTSPAATAMTPDATSTSPAPTSTSPAPTSTSPAPTSTSPAPTSTSPAPTSTATTPMTKEVIRFQDSQWASLWANNAIAMYIVGNGYGYPVEEIQGTTGTMKVALPLGEVDVVMEIWRNNILEWYDTEIAAGTIVDLAGTSDDVSFGSKGQSLELQGQGFYVPTYVVEANPGLVSVTDLPDYIDLFTDPEDPTKGVIYNCIIGWGCQKINRAKWFAYGLYDTYNVTEPGTTAALDANIVGAYEAGEPVLSYYWEPTTILAELDFTLLEEPAWNQECQDALDLAVESSPYESTIGCAFPLFDIHTGVYSGLVDRAPEVVEFLANFFVGSLPLGVLEAWKNDNDATWQEAGINWMNENRDVWTTWITDANAAEIIADVDAALALEG